MPHSINEELADRAAAHAIDLLRFDADARRQILGFLARLEVELERKLRLSRLGDRSTAAFNRESRLRALLVQVQQTIRGEYQQMAVKTEKLLADVARLESVHAVGGFKDLAVIADLDLNVLSPNQLKAIASNAMIDYAPSREWWSRQSRDLTQRFADEMRLGSALGETTDDLVRRVRGRATGRRHKYVLNGRERTFVEFAGGLMDTSTRNAEALVRTSVQTIAGEARRETFRENQDVVMGVVQVSVLDLRTTVECLLRNGKAWAYPDMTPIDHDIAYDGGVPRKWNCRSTESPLLKSWQELGIDLEDRGVGTRWSRLDGEVPADFTMEQFLNRRSDAQVDDMLGKGAASLWRYKKISLEDLVSRQTGRPLTLAELEALAGVAA